MMMKKKKKEEEEKKARSEGGAAKHPTAEGRNTSTEGRTVSLTARENRPRSVTAFWASWSCEPICSNSTTSSSA